MTRSLHPTRGACLALLLGALLAPPLAAGDYHQTATLRCDQCHVMHFAPGGAPATAPGSGVGKLLLEDVNDLCLSCHDGQGGAADVLGPAGHASGAPVRQAGFLNREGFAGAPGSGHTLGARDVAPGSDPSWKPEGAEGLACVDCHAPHGTPGASPAYRNLRDDAGNNLPGEGLVTYNHGQPGVNDPTRDVFVRRALDYDESAVDFNEPDPSESAVARFCAGCHSAFHGPPGGPRVGGTRKGGSWSAFLRHPTAGVDVGAAGGEGSSLQLFAARTNRVKLMSASGSWSTPGADVTPTCITCHKAHGNANPFGLIYRSGRGTLTEDGDSEGDRLEHLCGQCHVQAAAFALP